MDTGDILRLIISAATPLIVVILGILLLRRIEGVKASVALRSDFHRKWANHFFECCQEFMVAIERELALLTKLGNLGDPNGEEGNQLLDRISAHHLKLMELELRIRRSVVFAPETGTGVRNAADTCTQLLRRFWKMKQGNVDEILEKMNSFNKEARVAHAEIIGGWHGQPRNQRP